jgi:hypothetical protein
MKTIKLITLFLFVAASFQVVAAGASRQTRSVGGFHGVSVTSGIDLFLTQKSTEEVVVEANSEDIDKIITEVEGGVLKIYIKEKSWFNFDWKSRPRKVYVSFKDLDKIDASAGSDVLSENKFKLDRLKVDSSSGSDVKLELDAKEVRVASSSGSDISLKGTAISLQADASSGSDIDAGEFQTQNCDASASSGSDVKVYVTEKLNANASSGGDVYYTGNPKNKDINESSGGDVHSR